MSLLRLLVEGLGGPPRDREEPVVWIDCADVGLADLGLARADVVVVPEWGRRCEVVRWARRAGPARVVVEIEESDVAVRSLVHSSRVWVVRWSDGPGGRRFAVSPSGAAARVVRDRT